VNRFYGMSPLFNIHILCICTLVIFLCFMLLDINKAFFCFWFLADRTNDRAYATKCLSVCLSVTHVLLQNGATYRKTA